MKFYFLVVVMVLGENESFVRIVYFFRCGDSFGVSIQFLLLNNFWGEDFVEFFFMFFCGMCFKREINNLFGCLYFFSFCDN